MIKATAKAKDGRTVLLLGLSHRNLDRLREDGMKGFIKVDGKETGDLPIDIIITAAPTEADLTEGFKEFIGPNTVVHVSNRLKM